jgi:hypothetical protein
MNIDPSPDRMGWKDEWKVCLAAARPSRIQSHPLNKQFIYSTEISHLLTEIQY